MARLVCRRWWSRVDPSRTEFVVDDSWKPMATPWVLHRRAVGFRRKQQIRYMSQNDVHYGRVVGRVVPLSVGTAASPAPAGRATVAPAPAATLMPPSSGTHFRPSTAAWYAARLA